MKIVHLIVGLGTGGAETMLSHLVSDRRPEINHIVVSLTDRGTHGPRLEALGIPVHTLGLRRAISAPLRIPRLAALIRRLEPDLIQGWMYHANLLASVVGSFGAKRTPVFWNVRHSLSDWRGEKPLTRRIIRLGAAASRQPVRILYNSEACARQHEDIGYAADRTVIVPNGFDTDRFIPDPEAGCAVRTELGLGPDDRVIGLIGRFHRTKGHDLLLKAAARVAPHHPNLRFLLAGPDVVRGNPDLARLLTRIPDGRVRLLGERRDIHRLMPACDLVVSASRGEGFSNVVGEAMACGVPCLVTDVGDSARIVADTGFVIPPDDGDALAECLAEIAAFDRNHLKNLGDAARDRIVGVYGLPFILQRYRQLYEAVLSEGKGDA